MKNQHTDAQKPTSIPGLFYRNDAPGLWRFVDSEGAAIGGFYPSRFELLTAVPEFARERGYTPKTKHDRIRDEAPAMLEALRDGIKLMEMSHREGTAAEREDSIRTTDEGDLCPCPDNCGQCLHIRTARAILSRLT